MSVYIINASFYNKKICNLLYLKTSCVELNIMVDVCCYVIKNHLYKNVHWINISVLLSVSVMKAYKT